MLELKNKPELEGPKVLGTIDLSAINSNTRPKKKTKEERRKEAAKQLAANGEGKKKKRSRIGDAQRVDINAAASQSQQNGGNGNKGGGKKKGGSQQAAQQAAGSKKSKKKAAKEVKVEISDEDVAKQVRETLARLTSKPKMAKGAKYLNKDIRVYTLLGDGEIEEGQVWEAMMFASQYKLDNLCVIIDANGLQIDGPCGEVMSAEPIDEKLKAFGFEVTVIDGNDFDALEGAFDKFHQTEGKPFAVIMKTVKGLGVSYMENEVGWHGKAPNDEEYRIAMEELTAKLKEWEA